MTLDEAIAALDQILYRDPDEEVQRAWAAVRMNARLAKRLKVKTMPRIADVAQHAVAIREALDRMIPSLPPTLYTSAIEARDHVLAVIDASRTGRDSEPPP